jgi:hypothetical protein
MLEGDVFDCQIEAITAALAAAGVVVIILG